MIIEQHANQLGSLVANFHSLEFVLRIFLNRLPNARSIGVPLGTNIYTLAVGTELPENDLTSYETLGELIKRYNLEVTAHKAGDPIDPSLVIVRDALAHGRVSSNEIDEPLRLLKFDKPSKGYVRITFNELMNEPWFKAQKKRVYDAIFIVHNAYKTITASGL
jgi:hypothetical protein